MALFIFTPRSRSTLHLISISGPHAAIFFLAVLGPYAALHVVVARALLAAVWPLVLPVPHAAIWTGRKPRPPVTVWLGGRPVPRILVVPMVPLGGVAGLGARAALGTGVCRAAGSLPPPITLLHLLLLLNSCLRCWCSLGLQRCPLTPTRAASRLAALALPPAANAGSQRASKLSECWASGGGPLL